MSATTTPDVGSVITVHRPGCGTYRVVDTGPIGPVLVPVDPDDFAETGGGAIVLPHDMFVAKDTWEQVG